MATKKKPALSPAAAKILEQYRNANKPTTPSDNAPGSETSVGTPRASSPPPPGAASMRRSGTRGK
jgi:hypothetical protein